MKKLVSLLIAIVLLSSALAGCDLTNMFGVQKSKSTDGASTTSTTKPLFPENPIIEHGDNFTEDDIEFVLTLHGKTRNDRALCDMPPNYQLYDVLTFAQNGAPLFLAHFDSPYFICAYLKLDSTEYEVDQFGDYKFDATKYVWYKFYDSTKIPEKIGEMKLTAETYLLYDCTIVKDIANGIEHNKVGKYYMQYKSDKDLEIVTSKMLLYYDYPSWIIGESKFMPYVKYGAGTFEIFTNENNVDYLYFVYQRSNQDGTQCVNYAINTFGYHYDALSQYFEILNEYIGNNDILIKDGGIRLDILVEYLSK